MNINIDFNDLRERAIELAQTGVVKAKELTDTGMAKAKELTDTGVVKAKELTDTGVAKAKELAEISKVKVSNLSEQDTIRRAYMELGRLYYAERGSAPEAPYADLCQKITNAKEQIQRNEQRITNLKSVGHLPNEDMHDICQSEFEAADWSDFDDDQPLVQGQPVVIQDASSAPQGDSVDANETSTAEDDPRN